MERIEEKLLEGKWVEPWQLDRAKVEAHNQGQSLWANLVKFGFFSEEDFALFLAQECGIPYVKVSDYAIDQAVLHLVEENFSLQNQIIPLFKLDNTLFLACSNPLDSGLLDSVSKMTGCVIEPLVSEAHAILGALDLYWRLEEKNFELAKFIIKQNTVQGFVQWRGAERLSLKLPFKLKILDDAITLLSRRVITGNTLNISSDVNAIGVLAPIFLPPGVIILISLEVKQDKGIPDRLIELRGEIVRSAMIKPREYLLGIKVRNISEAVREELMRFVLLK